MLVSIVVPIYNMEKYLERCLDSLVNQTYKEIEVILINDGSLDSSEEICLKYASKNPRIKYYLQTNTGLSGARNSGLRHVKGDYVLFVDPDDWIGLNVVETLVSHARLYNFDAVVFPYVAEYGQKSVVYPLLPSSCQDTDCYQKVYPRFFGLQDDQLDKPQDCERFNPVWNKLYKREIIDGIWFTDTQEIGTEDAWFNIQVLLNKKIGYCPDVYYHYFKENSHSLTKKHHVGLFDKWQTLYRKKQDFIQEHQLTGEYEQALNNRIVLNLFSLVLNIISSDMSKQDKKEQLRALVNHPLYVEKMPHFPIKKLPILWQVFYTLCARKRVSLLYWLVTLAIQTQRR